MNFIHNYYTLYPVGAPATRLIPRYIANGPRVEIFYARPLTFYNQPTILYREPIIIRDSSGFPVLDSLAQKTTERVSGIPEFRALLAQIKEQNLVVPLQYKLK